YDDNLTGRQSQLLRLCDRMRAFESRNDSLEMAQFAKCFKRFRIIDARVFHATGVVKFGVLRADTPLIQARGTRLRGHDPAIAILKNVGEGAVKHTRPAA